MLFSNELRKIYRCPAGQIVKHKLKVKEKKFCNYTDVETILFLKIEILDMPNLENDIEDERDRGTEGVETRNFRKGP